MIFERMCELPYGSFDGNNRVFKVVFVNYDHHLFLEGYKVYNIPSDSYKVYALKKLNEITDYSVIDLDDSSLVKELETDKEIEMDIANDTVNGFPKILSIKVKYSDKPLDTLDTPLLDLYSVAPGIARFIDLNVFIEMKKSEELGINIDKSLAIKNVLASIVYDESWLSLFDDDWDREMFRKIFPIVVPFTIGNLIKFIKISRIIKNKDYAISYKTFMPSDIVFGMRLVENYKENVVAQNMKGLLIKVKKTVLVDFTKPKEEIKEALFNILSSFYRVTKIKVLANKKEVINKKTLSYRDIFMENFNKNGIFSFSFDDGYFIIFSNEKSVNYKTGNIGYASPQEMNDDFEIVSLEDKVFEIELSNE